MIDEITELETPENMRYSYLDKFQILEGPLELPPNKCAGCGFAIYEKAHKYVDWNFSLEFYGQVVFCVDCFRQAANQLGYMDPDQTERLIDAKCEQVRLNSELVNEVARLRDALASLGLIGLTHGDTHIPIVGEMESEPDLPVDNGKFARAKQRSNKSTDVGGSADVSSDDIVTQLLGDSI